MRIIDFHTHLDGQWFGKDLPPASAMVRALDRFDVEAACVMTVMGLYGDCERQNRALLERASAYPDRLIPFVTVDPKEGRAAATQLEGWLADPLVRGVKLHPWLQAFAPSMVKEAVTAILRLAAGRGVPVMCHDGTPPYCTTFQIAEMARWVPEATVVLGHAGLADYVDAAAQLLRDIPNLHACYCGPRPGDLEHLVATAGAEKVLFGSDFGAAGWELLPERIDNVLEADLRCREREQILYGNASRVLHLAESPLGLPSG